MTALAPTAPPAPGGSAVPAGRRRPALALVAHQLRYEQLAFWRNPAAAFFIFAFPVMFLVLFASINGNTHVEFLGGLRYNQYYVPAITAFAVISACYSSLGVAIPVRREQGLLKRMRATPMPGSLLLGSYVVNSLLTALLLVALSLGVGTAFFGLVWHGHLVALAASLVLGSATFCALGLAVASAVPNGDAAGPIVNFALFPISFISGTFYPIQSSSTLSKIADYLPVRPFTQAVFAPFNPATIGWGFDGRAMLTMGCWFVAGCWISVRFWRWQPKR